MHETPMPHVGDELHHFGWNRCSSACHGPDRSHLIVPGFRSSRIHVLNVADALLNWLRTYAFAHTTSRMDAILGSQLFRHLVALPIAYFESRATGQTVARVRELENVRQFITSSALTLVIDVVFGLIFHLLRKHQDHFCQWFCPPHIFVICIL